MKHLYVVILLCAFAAKLSRAFVQAETSNPLMFDMILRMLLKHRK